MSTQDYAILSLVCAAFGLASHILLYRPSDALPVPWRNMTRYAIGGLLVVIPASVYILLYPNVSAGHHAIIPVVSLFSTGYGVLIGYLVTRDA